jgi:hypothetical protein
MHCGKIYTPDLKPHGHTLEKTPVPPILEEDVPGPIQKERSQRRMNKAPVMTEMPEPSLERPDEAPIAIDMAALEGEIKLGQTVER